MPKNPEDDARASTTTITLQALNQVIALLKQANVIMDKVQSGWVVPDAPERPPTIAALTTIKAQASHASGVASRLLASTEK